MRNDVGYRIDATVDGLFREQAAVAPERIALASPSDSMTYGELDRRSSGLARALVARGVGPDVPVALIADRSAESIVAVLAILKAGGAYLPLDASYPVERLSFVLADANAPVLLADRRSFERCAQLEVERVLLDESAMEPGEPLPARARAENLAYVMYTSGSTGTPKGVQIEHRSIVRLVGRVDYVNLGPETRMLHAAPLGFDASTLELWGPLLHGGQCVIYPDPIPTGPSLRALIRTHGVTTAWLTAALFNSIVDDDPTHLLGLCQLFTGGEALSVSHVRRALAALPGTELINGYGPTECTTFSTTFSIPRDTPAEATSIPIGRPIADTHLYVLDEQRNPVAAGELGELYIGGRGVARGYLRRPELDAERFVEVEGAGRLYRTGDLVRLRDGLVDFVGRADRQVKIRGFRIELGEIEAALGRVEGITSVAVLARDDGQGKRLVAYVVGDEVPSHALREQLARSLPEFMIPSAFVHLPALPITTNGKLDRAALPAPNRQRPDLAEPYRTPRPGAEATIARVFAEVLGLDRVGALDGFLELGGNSLLVVRALAKLRAAGLPEISLATFFEAPTPEALARTPGSHVQPKRRARTEESIAIVGMAGRFPGARDVETFWKNLCEGRESIRFFRDDELDEAIPVKLKEDPAYVRARGVLDDVEQFDAGFFGISPLEAQLMDPQHRHFLEVCWEALEHAGHVPERIDGAVGVFGGMFNATYFQRHVSTRPDLVERLGELNAMLANEKDYLTSRVAHRLGLRGPAMSIHTACSTSLVAVSTAIDSLRSGQCDVALAGGVAITCPPNSGHLYQEGSMASSDGHTRPFDESATGTVFSDGVAVVVLKRISDALADGDEIYAVLRGATVNNDGAGRASFTAPSAEGQATVIAAAHEAAGVDPRTISYVEAHGTATPLGDPIEIEGLTRAFRRGTDDVGFCAIGSLKGNVGHLVTAAGVASLVKVSLALHHGVLPPSINFERATTKVDFAKTPFRVCTSLTTWASPRRAGVSSFGFGGTNAHAILEEAPQREPSSASTRPGQLLVVSARSPAALEEATGRLVRALEGDAPLADIAHTTRVGRRAFTHRRYVVARSHAEAAEQLRRAGSREVPAERPDVAFLAPGQGSQYAQMGRGLYEAEPVFREAYDACCGTENYFEGDLTATSVTQPAIFALEYALARLWMSWGVRPTALIGHSVGEFVCAVLAEVMSLDDALGLVRDRGALMQALPEGAMLSVRLPARELERRLPIGVDLAAENAPSLSVAAGPFEAIDALARSLEAEGVVVKRLVTSHAFHSSMMDPALEPFAARVATVRLSPPRIPIVSTVTGDWLDDEQATSVRYWSEHLRRPVRFAPAATKLLEAKQRVLIEIGPRATLSALARQAVSGKRMFPVAIPSLADAPERESDSASAALGQLWALGASVDFDAFAAHERRRRVPLPTYPFEHQRHWIDAARRPEPPIEIVEEASMSTSNSTRQGRLIARVCELVEEVSGEDVSAADPSTPWLELGLDSLALTQLALQIGRTLSLKVSLRDLLERHGSIDAIVQLLDAKLPPDPVSAPVPKTDHVAPSVRQVLDQQLQLTQQLLALLGGKTPEDDTPAGPVAYDVKKAFGAIARIHTKADELTPHQRARLDAFMRRYNERTRNSKAYTERHRGHMADPRVVNGFRPLTKEITYQIVIERSRGSRLWDIDGNEYVDALNGFGMNMFGWQPDFLRRAMHEQIDRGCEIGPQHVLAGEVAELFCELTGAERAAFCNTGSEAVMGTMRIARTVTGRSTIAIFTGGYHGIFDEVIVRGTKKLKSVPAAPGIMPSTSQNVLVLDYGTPESLEILRARAHELAAIVVEPVQSRRPDFQPREFLRELRSLTEKSGSLFIFDEVVTGFRSHPGGAQALFGIRADLASYGKVVGGGNSIGVIAGKREYMDALDGGPWQYGDGSIPSVGVTYFAGTFVRHPLALATAKATLLHLKEEGPRLQENLTAKASAMAAELNAHFEAVGAPMRINQFASLWRNAFTEDLPYADLVYAMIRDRGVHILDNFPCFLTTAHTDEDIALIVRAYKEAVAEMQESGFFPPARQCPSSVRRVPSTEPQREVWLATRFGADASLAFNESVSLHLRGELDIDALRAAVRELPKRHDALRSVFSSDGLELIVGEAPELEVPLHDGELEAVVERHVTEPFDLEKGPLVRAELVRLAHDHHVLVFTGHHIVLDGWSYWVLVKELAALYSKTPLPAAPSFASYAIDQHERASAANEQWWVDRFADSVPTLELPTDRVRPKLRTQASGRVDYMLPASLLAAVRKAGARHGASLFATLLAGFDVLLHRLTGQTDLVVGIPAAGQNTEGLEGLVGHCVGMLPLRTRLSRTQSFAELLSTSRQTVLDAFDHQDVTFGRVLQKLPIARDPSRLPLISVVFNIDQALTGEGHAFHGLELAFESNARRFENFELFVNAVDAGSSGMRLECQYNRDLFDEATVRRWLASFETLLSAAANDPGVAIGKLPILTHDDREELARWNGTEAAYPRDTRIEELIAATIRRCPEKIAVRGDGFAMTYGELGERAHAVAARLRARGVGAGDLVGLLVDRDEHLLVGLLGVLEAGAGYLPLDPSFPAERIAFMLDDAKAKTVATTTAASARVAIDRVLLLDSTSPGVTTTTEQAPSADDVAYVIYTSGSTGRPKGVRVPHRAVVNFLTSMQREPGLGQDDRLVAVTTLSFDIAVLELLLPLTVGAEVVLATREQATDGAALSTLIERSSATVMQATPATWRMLIDAGFRGGETFTALCGGEALPRELADALQERCGALWNMYGPTETTVWSTCHRVRGCVGAVPIGGPIANTRVRVLDEELGEVPIGVTGEIYIGGDGVTLGYLDRPELTSERFVADPFSSGRLYRTGDLGRWNGSGVLECLGRIDHQIKLRGYRIELGEIEVALSRHPSIARAVVVAREDRPGDKRLVAYVIAAQFDERALRAHLALALPEYMIPSHFVALEAIPLLPNGKVDHRSLPAPAVASSRTDADDAPETATERMVGEAFCELLGLPRVGLHDDFFALGGHSLLAAQMTARLGRALGRVVPMRAVFERPTVSALAALIDLDEQGSKKRELPRLERRQSRSPAPLSLMQQRLWYLEQLEPGRAVHNIPSAHWLRGPLNQAAFQRAFDELLRRQSSLRTSIGMVNGEPVQVVAESLRVPLFPAVDLSSLPKQEREREIAARLVKLIAEPFELTRGPLFRARMFKLGPDDHVFFFMPHHLIWDGWSFDLLYEEMAALYGAYSRGDEPTRPAPSVTYQDFTEWHRSWLAGEELERQIAFWKDKLAGAPDALDLPVDRPRPPRQSGKGSTEWITISPELAKALRDVGQREGATLFMTLLAAWTLLLHRHSGQREVVVGTPVRGRNLPELEDVMGFFVNALPLRLAVDSEQSFTSLLRSIRAEVMEAFDHQDVPFEQLVRVLDVPRDESRFPIYQAFFSFQDVRGRSLSWGDLEHERVRVFQPASAQDLSLWLVERPQGLVGGLNYNTDIFDVDSVKRFQARFLELIARIAHEPNLRCDELASALPDECAELQRWNETTHELPAERDLARYLGAAMSRNAQRVAIRCGSRTLTHGQLWSRAGEIAAALAERGVGEGDVVAIHLERSPDMLAALLGALRVGATYLPLDPEFPRERLRFMLEDANARVIVSDGGLGDEDERMLRLDLVGAKQAPEPPALTGEEAAYVIYTSGSTGKPKGVRVSHRSVINFLSSMQREPGLRETDRLVAVTTLSFDIAVLELLLPLVVGAEIVLATREQATDGAALRGLIEQSGATVMQATPATWRMLIEAGFRGSRRFTALCGGEALSRELADALHDRCGALFNMYGPTETTVWSSVSRIVPGEPISIGRPIANTQIWILDERGALAPIGVPGEICIGGEGVALGYHARPELTTERFISFGGHRVYRTGDRGRVLADGRLVHLGRSDHQVKVRGYRIELGEIESVLASHPAVARAVVDARPGPGGEKRLVAYLVTRNDRPDTGDLRAHVRTSLPDYMVPTAFVLLERLPLTPNGKIDRRALPEPTAETVTGSESLARPRSATEKTIAAVWTELLGLDRVALDDNFLDVGGHSLLIMRALAMLEAKTGKRVSPRSYVFNSLEQIAHEYDRVSIEPPPRESIPRHSGVIARVLARLTQKVP